MTQVLRYSAKMLTFVKEEIDGTRREDCAYFNYIKSIIFFNSQYITFKHVTLQGKNRSHLLNSFFFSEIVVIFSFF